MSKIWQRLILFFAGIPLILLAVFCKSFFHLAFNVMLFASCFLCALELCSIFNSKEKILCKEFLAVLAAAIPLASFAQNFLDAKSDLCVIAFFASGFLIFSKEIFGKKDFQKSNLRLSFSICVIFYAGFLPSFITRLCSLENSSELLSSFLILVFISDSAAWLFGVLFGKSNRGIFSASPNKSVAGFVGAYLGCTVFAFLLSFFVFERAFTPSQKAALPKAACVLILAFAVCTTSVIGDLSESVLKRSANVKDSGKIMPGRGGILDCVDSIFMAAPFYYYLARFLFV